MGGCPTTPARDATWRTTPHRAEAGPAPPNTGAAGRAADWWRAHDPKCLNGWYNQIGVPTALGRAARVLGDRLPPADMEYVTGKVLPRARRKMTGTNLAWLSGNLLYLGLLTRDDGLVHASLGNIFSQAVVNEARPW